VRWHVSLGILLWSAACAPRNPDSTPEVADASVESPVITLERTACFGACPVYRLSVASDGTIDYEGKAHVRRLGVASTRIPPQRVEALLSELERAGYFAFANRYAPAEPVCGRYVTDSPAAITSVRFQGQTKRIEHDYGCGAAPGALTVLEQRIDEVLGSAQWTGR
jgi:Domain of unknown function (DUF6438)